MWLQQEGIDLKALYKLWFQCQKRKAGKAPAQRYEMNCLDYLFDTLQQLQAGTYQPTISYSFVTAKLKLKEIHTANFNDRVVHHLLVPQLEDLWEPVFIHDVYSNRKNKGTHKAVKRSQKLIHKDDVRYFIQLDIKNLFYSMHQTILMGLIEERLSKAASLNKIDKGKARFLIWLPGIFIKANYQNARELDKALSSKVPPHQQLKLLPDGLRLPIGNLTSQIIYRMYGMSWAQDAQERRFANVYLNELDQHIKHQLKCNYYLRFADDFILLSDDKQQLMTWQTKISHFLQTRLGLSLKELVQPQPLSNGANFLGFVVRPYYILIRKRVVNNLKEKLADFQKRLFYPQVESSIRSKGVNNKGIVNLNSDILNKMRSTLASYLGLFKHANSLKFIQAIFSHYHWLRWLFKFNESQWKLGIRYQPSASFNFKQQLLFFKSNYPCAKKIQKGLQSFFLLPQKKDYNSTIKQINIVQVGYNHIGIQQRCVQQIIFR